MTSPEPVPTRRDHVQALLLALLCSVLFLRDGLLPGRALMPHPPELFDVVMREAQAAGRFDPADAFRGNVAMTDKYIQSLCWDRVMQDRFRAGELPRWTNDIGGGAPFVAQMAQPWQPINALLLLLPSVGWYGVWYLLHLVLFGWFAYVFLRRLGCLHGSALLGLVAATLGLWTQCKLHHNVILTAALALWPMLTATHELVARGARGRARTFAMGWLALWTGLSWSTGFVVISLQATYLTLGLALLWTLQAERGDRVRRLLPFCLALLLGGALSLANMLPILWAKAASARATFDAASQAELGLDWDHLLTLPWPDLFSCAADRFYLPTHAGPPTDYVTRVPWSQLVLLEAPFRKRDATPFQNYVETAIAIGLVPLAGACAALFTARARALALTLFAIAALGFGIATADAPFLQLAQIVPGLNAGDLRREVFTVVMALVVLGALGIDAQLRRGDRTLVALPLASVLLASIVGWEWLRQHGEPAEFTRAVAAWIAADADHPQVQGAPADAIAAAMAQASRPGEPEHNLAMLHATLLRSLLVAAGALAALWLRRPARLLAWLALTIAELLHAGLGPVQTVPNERITQAPAVLQPVLATTPANGDRPRLCRLVPPDALPVAALAANLPGFLHIEDGSAYNPLPPARYEEFFARLDANCVLGGAGVGAFRSQDALRHPLADLYGLRFVLTPLELPTGPQLVERTPPGTGGYRLYERTTALPRATFVQQVDIVPDAAARLAVLGDRQRDVAHRLVLEDANAPTVTASTPANATVELVSRADERVVVRVDGAAAGYLRLADPFDAGWRATLDGQATTLYVADHYLRAVHVPAGRHEIVFTYDGPRVVWPLRATGLAWLVVLTLLWRGRRRA